LLDSTKSGILARQGETTLVISNGVLTYKAEGKAGGVSFNTVRTPNGAQYHLRLADGTDVWLNAASSLRFPTAFQGADRIVAITGEAYFEVAHDAAKPFRVETNGSQVEVLGTRFNVNAYEDGGQWKTTLIQGKVRVTRDKAKVVLLPGHQARLNAVTGRFDVKAANIEEALAWKNGNFQFENTDIKTVMNQIARWYNVEVVFKDGIPEGHYRFIIPRNTPVSSLITILNAGGIECKLEDKRIIVLK
jgi:ferric-dicitrate binding protein FerR (iron transport regulator)